VVGGYMNTAIPEKEWDIEGLNNTLKADFGIEAPLTKWLDEKLEISEIEDNIIQGLDEIYTYKEELATPEQMRPFEKGVMLQTLDNNWKEHLASMDYLRSSIGLRGYAQKNPIQEYKEESFKMFNELLDNINTDIVRALCTVQINQKPAEEIKQTMQQDIPQNVQYNHQENTQTTNTTGKKIGRNEPCPCGSGKKYKQCCGKK
jgi:preprotein translocase subunit SecA